MTRKPPASLRPRRTGVPARALACLLALALATPLLAPSSAVAAHGRPHARRHKPPTLSLYAGRALLAYRAMQQSFYVAGTGLYRGQLGYSFLWPFSQALAATVSLSQLPSERSPLADARRALMVGLRQYLSPLAAPAAPESGEPLPSGETSATEQPTGTEQSTPAPPTTTQSTSTETATPPGASPPTTTATPTPPAPIEEPPQPTATAASTSAAAPTAITPRSYDGNLAPPVGPGGDSYYDDNEWVGIELARIYRLEHNAEALQQAEQIMEFVMSSWRTSTPSGQPLPCPGGVPFSNAQGNLSRNTVTNGPGAELAVQLYRITHQLRYLEFAENAYGWVRACLLEPSGLYADHINLNGSIQRTLWSYNQGSMMGAGILLYLATRNPEYLVQARQTAKAARSYFTYSRLSTENPFFAAVYFRNLLYLDYFTHEPPGSLPVREYAYYAWLRHRLSTGLFAYGSPPTTELLRQAAIVQVYALLSISPTTYF